MRARIVSRWSLLFTAMAVSGCWLRFTLHSSLLPPAHQHNSVYLSAGSIHFRVRPSPLLHTGASLAELSWQMCRHINMNVMSGAGLVWLHHVVTRWYFVPQYSVTLAGYWHLDIYTVYGYFRNRHCLSLHIIKVKYQLDKQRTSLTMFVRY